MNRDEIINKIAKEAFEEAKKAIIKGIEYSDFEESEDQDFMDLVCEVDLEVRKKVAKMILEGEWYE